MAFNHKYNTDDAIIRANIVGLVNELNDRIFFENVWEDGKKEIVRVPFFYAMSGDERFLQDYFSNWKYCAPDFIEGNTDPIPRGTIYLSGFSVLASNLTSRYVRGYYTKETENGELKRFNSYINSIPIQMNFTGEILTDTSVDSFKIVQAITSYLYRTQVYNVNFMGFRVPTQVGFPDTYNVGKQFEFEYGNTERIKVTFDLEIQSYLPVVDAMNEFFAGNQITSFNPVFKVRRELLEGDTVTTPEEPFECVPAFYKVQYVGGELIEEGEIASGGSVTINVPVCPGNVEWEIRDEDGNLLGSGTQPSGVPLTITAPDASITITDTNNTVLYVFDVNSGGTKLQIIEDSVVNINRSDGNLIFAQEVNAEGVANYNVADSVIEVRNSLNNVVDSGNVKATENGNFNAPDGDVNIRKTGGGLIETKSTPSGDSVDTEVADSVVNIKDSANNTLKSENIKATETENVSINDSVAVIKDTAGTTLKSENILAEATENITINDSTLNVNKSDGSLISSRSILAEGTDSYNVPDSIIANSDNSYIANVMATDSLVLPDQDLNVNGNKEGDVPSVKNIDIEIEDNLSNFITPDSITITGGVLMIEVPAGVNLPIEVNGNNEGSIFSIGTIEIEVTDGVSPVTPNDVTVSGRNVTIEVPDGDIENSDASYTASVESGGVLVLPDQTIEVNTVNEGSIPSVGTIEIDITDGTNPVTPDDVTISGRTITIEVPSGASPSGILYSFPALSGQWTSFRTGDDGWLAQNGWYDYTRPANPLYVQELDLSLSDYYYRLKHNNVFGNKLRFTDVDGAQVFGSTGNKNLVFIDHLTGLMWTRTRIVNANWDTFIDTSLTHSVTVDSVLYDDWAAPSIEIFKQLFMSQSRLIQDGSNVIFNMNQNGDNKSSTTNLNDTTGQYIIRTSGANNFITIASTGKATSDGGYYCRKHLL
jgi:hypothetical protein